MKPLAWFFTVWMAWLSLVLQGSRGEEITNSEASETLIERHVFESDEDVHRMTIFPRQQVPQLQEIREPSARAIAVNVRLLALLPGDRLTIRDPANTTVILVTAQNQTNVRRIGSKPLFWNHPFFLPSNTAIIEYWPSFWTLILPINRPQHDNPVVIIDSYSYARSRRSRPPLRVRGHTDSSDKESQVGATNDMKPAVCFKDQHPAMYQSAKAVARLIIQANSESSDASAGGVGLRKGTVNRTGTFCTGWLVGKENHLMTNYHCFISLMNGSSSCSPASAKPNWDSMVASNSQVSASASHLDSSSGSESACLSASDNFTVRASVTFMDESLSCSAPTEKTGIRDEGVLEAANVSVIVASARLDYCLLQVHPRRRVDLSTLYGSLMMRASGPLNNEPIFIPQHPNGRPKEIAATKDGKPAILRLPSSLGMSSHGVSSDAVLYNADTAPGSSGSPVLSQCDHTVVALHRAGWTSGANMLRAMTSSDSSADYNAVFQDRQLNSGIRIDAIVRDLQARGQLPASALAQDTSSSPRPSIASSP